MTVFEFFKNLVASFFGFSREIDALQESIRNLNADIEERKKVQNGLEAKLAQKNTEIQNLNAQVMELKAALANPPEQESEWEAMASKPNIFKTKRGSNAKR